MKSSGNYKAVINVKDIIDASGKSIAQIAEESGLAYNTVLQYYRGSIDGVRFTVLGSIAKVLNVPPGDFFEKEVIENH